MTRLMTFVTAAGVVLVALVVGFWFGFREGTTIGIMVNSVPLAGISLHHIERNEGRLTHNTVVSLEGDVDQALMWTYQLDRYPLRPWLEPVWGMPMSVTTKSLPRLAEYRKTHPSPFRAEALAKEFGNDDTPLSEEQSQNRKWILDANKEIEANIAAIVAKYATAAGK